MTYIFSNSTLTINGKCINFANEIRDVKELNDILIIVLENASSGRISEQPQNNIYAIDSNAHLIWNIKDILHEDVFYPGIRVEGNTLIAIDVIGINHKIDINSKTELSREGIK